MNILTNDILKNIYSSKKDILNSSKKQISEVLDTLEADKSFQPKKMTTTALLDILFKDLKSNTKTKDVVLQILKDKSLSLDIKDTISDLKSILSELKSNKLSLKSSPIFEKLLVDIKNLDTKTLQNQIRQSGLFLESKLANVKIFKTLLPDAIKESLNTLKNIILNDKLKIDTTIIDKILNSKMADKNFINDIKELVQSSKINKNQTVIEIVAKLENLLQKAQLIESKVVNNMPIPTKDIKILTKEIVASLVKLDISKPRIKKIISKLNLAIAQIQNTPNIDKVQFLNLSLSLKLQRAVNLIKTELTTNQPKIDSHIEVAKLLQSLQSEVHVKIANKQIVPNQPLKALINPKEEIAIDIKANLLYLKDELGKSKSIHLPDTLVKIDKVLTNINYYQLLSYSANANILYLPLLWEGLDEGQISIKRLKQKRFFCEINLKLKEFGKIDLLIMLFDNIFINISIFTKSEQFLSKISQNLQFLKQGINSIGLVPANIYLYDSLKDDKIKKDTKSYVDAQQIGKGVNIHV